MRDLFSVKFDLRIKIYFNIIKEGVNKSDKYRGYLININKAEVKQKWDYALKYINNYAFYIGYILLSYYRYRTQK